MWQVMVSLCIVIAMMCFSVIDRRGIIVTEDSDQVRLPVALPAAQAATATDTVTNEAFHNSTIANVNPSAEDWLVTSDNVRHVLLSL